METSGKIAVIAAVGNGIGRPTALALYVDRFSVVLAARHREMLEQTAALSGAPPPEMLGVPTGVADPASIASTRPRFAPTEASAARVNATGRDLSGATRPATAERAGASPLPAASATVATYLAAASEQFSAGALARRAAARHRQHRLVTPAFDLVRPDGDNVAASASHREAITSASMISRLMRLLFMAVAALAPLPAVSQQPLSPPDVTLVDQDGVRHRFVSDLIAGRIAVVSFVFTGCTTICSPVGANMGALDALLGGQIGSRVSLLSVTLDPFNDTPERLAKWRGQFDDKPGWRLLTGDPDEVDRVLYAMRQSKTDIAQHDAFLWVGDPRTKTWTRVSSLAAPETLAALIRRMEDE